MRSKYLNKKTEVDGIVFDSKKEAKHYWFLKQMEKAGEISDLRMQVHYILIPAVKKTEEVVTRLKTKVKVETKERTIQKAIEYVADFVYIDNKTGKTEVVDVKSPITRKNPVYILKKKMMFALNGITIKEI